MSSVPYTSPTDWPIGSTAFVALDNDAGSDANLGFSLVDMPTAGAAPLKTLTEFFRRASRFGAGRQLVVALKPRAGGATYKKPDGVTDDDIDCRGFQGYQLLNFEATTDFSNTAADKIIAGAQRAQVGPNGDGSWTVAAGATTTVFSVSAGALSAETAITDKRVRFTGNVTPALANSCRAILANTGTQISLAAAVGSAPAAGDTFFIEEPGVRVGRIRATNTANNNHFFIGISQVTVDNTNGCVISGPNGLAGLNFCESVSTVNLTGLQFAFLLSSVPREDGTFPVTGTSCRTTRFFAFLRCGQVSLGAQGALLTSSVSTVSQCGQYFIGVGYMGPGIQVNANGIPPRGNTGGTSITNGIGSFVTGAPRTRFTGAAGVPIISIIQSDCQLRGVDIQNAGGQPGVGLFGVGMRVSIDDVQGSTGNTDAGIDLTSAWRASIVTGNIVAATLTGTAGDVRLAGPAITTWAGLTITNVIDKQGNELIGTAGAVVRGQPRLILNQSGGALAIGKIVRGNGTSGQCTSAQADTAANASNVLGVLITPPASGANGYVAPPGPAWVQMDVAATVGNQCYLSEATAGNGKSVPPAAGGATNQKERCGPIQETSGTLALVVPFVPEKIPIDSDGAAP